MKEQKEIIMDFEKLPQDPGDVLAINTRDKSLNQVMRDTVVELKRIVREKNLDGLTACQIGVNERIMVMNFGGDIKTFINPVLVRASDFTFSREKCIHFPGKEYIVPRNKEIVLNYETPLGAVLQSKFIGRASMVAQHLIWHMDGLYVDDVGFEIDSDWDKLSEDEKAEIIKTYAESLDVQVTELNEELSKSEEAMKLQDAIEFEQALARGEVSIKSEKVAVMNTSDEENTEEVKE